MKNNYQDNDEVLHTIGEGIVVGGLLLGAYCLCGWISRECDSHKPKIEQRPKVSEEESPRRYNTNLADKFKK